MFGLNDAEITGTALPFIGKATLAGINIKVLHPVLCLEGKLRCLSGLPQLHRQDLKHLKMSILCVQALLRDFCRDDDPRPGLKLVERVVSSALREDGLNAWHRYEVSTETAIPMDTIYKLDDPKWQRFSEVRYPQLMEQITIKRNRYQQIMERIASRTTEQ